jgi:hypothetical protein
MAVWLKRPIGKSESVMAEMAEMSEMSELLWMRYLMQCSIKAPVPKISVQDFTTTIDASAFPAFAGEL